jgi:hypothetical protein
MARNTAGALLFSTLALALAACSSSGGDAVTVNPNIFPTQYKAEIIATLRPMFAKNDTSSVTGAQISPPVLTPVDKDQRYSLCIHYTAHGGSGYAGTATRRAYFFGGHLNQLIPVSDDTCAGVAYQPFNELNRICVGEACEKTQKSKSGWGLF